MTTAKERLQRDEEELAALMNSQRPVEEVTEEEVEAQKVIEDEDVSTEEKTFAKRFSDTQRAWRKDKDAWQAREKELMAKIEELESNPPEAMPKDLEELEEWKSQYPEVAKAIEAIAAQKAIELQKGLQEKVDTLSKKEQETTLELVKTQVTKVHPDFDDLSKSDDFHEWVKDQEPWIADTLYRGLNAKTAIQAINLYKLENGLLQSEGDTDKKSAKAGKSRGDADAAKAVTRAKPETISGTPKKLKESEILKWTDEEFEKNYDVIQKARESGNLIYDVRDRA